MLRMHRIIQKKWVCKLMKTENNNTTNNKNEIITNSHKFREMLMHAIEYGDESSIKEYKSIVKKILDEDSVDILKRVPGDPVRAYKNFLLSFNTLYGYAAEKGGVSPVQAHYISEKYAIMIEYTNYIEQLTDIHDNIIDECVKAVRNARKIEFNTISQKIINYIELNFSEDISVEKIANYIHVHPSHVMRIFKKEMNATITSYINNKRIEEAKELLAKSKLSVTDISIMVGFSDPQYFSRVFKKLVFMTPKEYRAKFRP